MSTNQSYKDLHAWQKAMDLVCDRTRQFPREELFGLATFLRRAAVSIPSKIADRHEQQARFASLASETGKIVNGVMNSMERYAVAHGR